MIKKRFAFSLAFLLSLFASVGFAQEFDQNYFNPNSVRPIRSADQMYKKTVWYRVDLRQKQNEGFWSQKGEITKIIIDAVKAGILRPYQNDSLKTRMTPQEFLDNLKMPGTDGMDDPLFGGGDSWGGGDDAWGGGGDAWGGGGGDSWGDSGGGEAAADPAADEFFPNQLYLLEIREDQIFDRKRSRLYHDIQSISIYIPSELNPAGLEKRLATFSYKELVENVFVANPDAVWFNDQNLSENKNIADAFELRLFSGNIVKYSNAKDALIEDIYPGNQKMALGKSQEFEYSQLEYESNLWSN